MNSVSPQPSERRQFEYALQELVEKLSQELDRLQSLTPLEFEAEVRSAFGESCFYDGASNEIKAQGFPDIPLGRFGVEVKHTVKDTWRSIANSIAESNRHPEVEFVYVVFAKLGGEEPAIRWARYEDCVMHVRTSHVPRFEIEIGTETPLFQQFGVDYGEFSKKSMSKKMEYVRQYARGRLKPGERLWWLEDESGHDSVSTLDPEVRLFKNLSSNAKQRLRGELMFVSPRVFTPGNSGANAQAKYDDALLFMLIQHGIFNTSGRDIFTAGSATKNSFKRDRDGVAINRAAVLAWGQIQEAAITIPVRTLEEYWQSKGIPEHPTQRLLKWVEVVDSLNPEAPFSQALMGAYPDYGLTKDPLAPLPCQPGRRPSS